MFDISRPHFFICLFIFVFLYLYVWVHTELTALIFFIPVAGSGTWWILDIMIMIMKTMMMIMMVLMMIMTRYCHLCSDQTGPTSTLSTGDLGSSQVKGVSQVPGFNLKPLPHIMQAAQVLRTYKVLGYEKKPGKARFRVQSPWPQPPPSSTSMQFLHLNRWHLAKRVWVPTSLPTTTSFPFTVNLTSSSTSW